MNEHMRDTYSFFDISKHIVEKFIQSVVAVDDGMVFSSRDVQDEIGELEEPDDDMGVGVPTEEGIISVSAEHKLYYQELSSAFARKGIICSGLNPLAEMDSIVNSILESSKNADITILDWKIDDKQGTLALEAINKIIESDLSEGGRLRLITIYTAENVPDVLEKLKTSLDTYNSDIYDDYVSFEKEELQFCKIDVVGKEVTETQLTEHVIESLTRLTAGLLSNAALSAITDTRNRTHNILYKFNKELDPAYLSHVLGLISSPDMREQAHEVAFDYAVDLISEEIKSELQISSIVKDALSQKSLKLWPKHVNSDDAEDFFGLIVGDSEEVKLSTSRVADLLTVETEDNLKENLIKDPKIADEIGQDGKHKDPLNVFKNCGIQLTVNGDSTSQHLELSTLQSIRRDAKTNGKNNPVMKQGSVVKKGKQFFVCIQPLCDSVRLKDDTNFTFLRISKVTGRRPFSHVMRNSSGHTKLCIEPSSKKIYVFRFKPCSECRMIKAVSNNDIFCFADSSGQHFEWCGEFKQAVSQEIANSVSASMSRVGLDSFEWLRLKGKSK